MEFGDVVVVEFGEVNNAAYVYRRPAPVAGYRRPLLRELLPTRSVDSGSRFKRRSHALYVAGESWRPLAWLDHWPSPGWQDKFSRRLAQLGVDVRSARNHFDPSPEDRRSVQ